MKKSHAYLVMVVIIGCIILGFPFVMQHIHFQKAITGHLKRAADANTLELAIQELERALDGAEREHLCNSPMGPTLPVYTSILWDDPEDDLCYWRQNLEASLKSLKELNSLKKLSLAVPEEALTISNALIKLRETLLDGNSVTLPSHIETYPYTPIYFALWAIAFVFIVVVMALSEKPRRNRR